LWPLLQTNLKVSLFFASNNFVVYGRIEVNNNNIEKQYQLQLSFLYYYTIRLTNDDIDSLYERNF